MMALFLEPSEDSDIKPQKDFLKISKNINDFMKQAVLGEDPYTYLFTSQITGLPQKSSNDIHRQWVNFLKTINNKSNGLLYLQQARDTAGKCLPVPKTPEEEERILARLYTRFRRSKLC
jgi:hypothetical protein